jgi:hypothetical protein
LRLGFAVLGAFCATAALAHAEGASSPAKIDAAGAAGWSVIKSAESGPVMSRNLGGVTSDLRLVGDEYNMFTPVLELSVSDCGGKRWWVSDSISPVGANTGERAARVRELMVQQFAKAKSACTLQADTEAKVLGGMEVAYAGFEAIRE